MVEKYKFEIVGFLIGLFVFYLTYENPNVNLKVFGYGQIQKNSQNEYVLSLNKPDLSYLLKRNPFSIDGKYSESKTGGSKDFKDLPDLKTLLGLNTEQFKILGIFIYDGIKTAVIVDGTGKKITIKEGEILPDGSVVKEIQPNSITIAIKQDKKDKKEEVKVIKMFDIKIPEKGAVLR
ncbi:MAG: hypothetical protein ACP5G3_04010 [Sulfurihydrogenibium sp.]|uniref:hypothetical protein n=1 Tax=Sulfurihydrogenibium sp. TaxID=2053621 RepID=UPI003D109EAD